MTDYQTFDHDVLIIGAGGAGLRAAIAASAAGVKVGLVCKSLLGKAHTVMAEGGVAAALGNVDNRDGWQVHFADTMRGGQYVNNWRMAELHAKEAPDRVRELEAWGAVFDRTADGRILQRNFGGHKYPRLAHVGDRTGLEMIRTLQDHSIHQGIDVHMECTVLRILTDGGRVAGALGYDRERGRFRLYRCKAIVLATGGVGRAYSITSNSWEYTGDGHALAYQAGAALQDMEFVQFHPTGMIWPPSVRGILVTEGVRGEGGVLRNREGRRFMFDDIPENYRSQTADNPEEGWRYTQGDKDARRPPELLTRDHVARCILREVREGRGSPHGGVFLDISWIKEKLPGAREHIIRKLPSMYHQFKQLADIDITTTPMEVGPTTHYIMGGIRVDGDSQSSTLPGLFAAGRVRRRTARGEPAGGQLAVGPAGVRQAGRRVRGDVRAGARRRGHRPGTGGRDRAGGGGAVRARGGRRRRGSVPGAAGPADDDAGAGRHRAHRVGDAAGAGGDRPAGGSGEDRRRHRQPGVQSGVAHGARPGEPAHHLRGDHPGCDRAEGEPGRTLPRGLSGEGCGSGDVQHRDSAGARTGRCGCRGSRSRRCRRS